MFDWSWWKIAYWLVGTLGVTGTIALAVLFPAAFGVAFKAVVRFFTIVLSYRIGCAVVAAVLAAFVADYVRHSIEDDKHAAAVAAFEEKQKQRDAKIAADTEKWVREETAAQWTAERDSQNEVDSFKKDLPVSDVFRVGADAVRLRGIAGEAVSGSGSTKSVPAPRRAGPAPADHRGNRLPGAGG